MSDVMCLHVSVYVLMEVLTRHVSDSTSAQHMCICHLARDQYMPSTTQSSWSPWERLTVHHTTFDYTRKLYNTSSSECLLQGYDSAAIILLGRWNFNYKTTVSNFIYPVSQCYYCKDS